MSDGKKLVAALLAAGSVETLRLADDTLFEDDELSVFQFVKSHYRRYGQLPDRQTVETETRARLPAAPETVEFYLRKVYDRRLFVSLREEFSALRDALQGFNVERAREVVDRMKNACRGGTPDNDVRNIGDATRLVMRQYDEAHIDPYSSGIPTGWEWIDRATGGYQRGDLIAWVARMGLGKTYLLLKQAIHAWMSGYSVLFVTMEMTIEQIVRRILGLESNINPNFLRHGAVDEYAMQRLQAYLRTMAHVERFTIYAGSFSKKVSDIEVLMHETTPDIVFIDGAYLLRPDNTSSRANRLERVAEVYDQLKRLTITTDRPLVTTSQFSRQAGKRGKDGSLETISFSDAIAMHSSVVFAIREGAPPYQRTRREVEILKGREGESGTFQLNYRFTPTDLSAIAPVRGEQQDQPADQGWMLTNQPAQQ